MRKVEELSSLTSGIIPTDIELSVNDITECIELSCAGHNALYKVRRNGRWYVFKGLKEAYRSQQMYRELLRKEFELAVSLDNPHIAQTFLFEYHDHLGPCIVMEWVDGVTLQEFLSTHPTRNTRCKVLAELLDAVAYLHARQMVHRDLKPGNIMITHNGNNVKLIDFGMSDNDSYAVLKQPAGTLLYAAPEQLEPGVRIDGRADIYSLGKIIEKIFPSQYRSVVKRCTQIQRDKRYENVQALSRAITAVDRLRSVLPFILVAIIVVGAFAWTFLRSSPLSTSIVPNVVYDTIVVEQGFTVYEQQIADKVSNAIRKESAQVLDKIDGGECGYVELLDEEIGWVVAHCQEIISESSTLPEVAPKAHKFLPIWNAVYENEFYKLNAYRQMLPSIHDAYNEGALSKAQYDSLQVVVQSMSDERNEYYKNLSGM